MKFLSLVSISVAALVGSAAAQSTTTTTAAAVPTPPAIAALTKCIADCDAKDVNCQAECIKVPFPDAKAANDTTSCVADCDQGKGTASDIRAYTTCRDDCISQHFFNPGTSSNTDDGDGSDNDSSSNSDNNNSTDSGNGDSPSDSSDSNKDSNPDSNEEAAAAHLMLGTSLGLIGIVAAIVAL